NPIFARKVANYLALHKNFKTEFLAETIDGQWLFFRGISKNSIDDGLEIYFSEIKKFMGEKMDNKLLKESMNEFGNKRKFKVKEIFPKIQEFLVELESDYLKLEIDYLILETNYFHKLEKQSICLVKFIEENFGIDNIIGYEANEVINEETVVDNYFKINYNGNYYVYRFNQEFDFINKYYFSTPEYKELFKCNKFIKEARPFEVDVNGRRFIDLNKLYKRFNPKQLYFNYIPIFTHEEKIKFYSNLIEKEEKCSICLEEFVSKENIITSCGVIFYLLNINYFIILSIYSTLIV
ncbi:hypothetical protein Mgra_00004532, partial [Meloidogyne graminicola]